MLDELNSVRERTVFRWVTAVSIFVFLAVLLLNRKVLPRPEPVPSFAYYLPALNALINGTCFILLLISYRAIRQKNIALHRKLNLTCFILSSVFLVCYITYHWMAEETRFPADNPLRSTYLTILVSHIILAAFVLPLILVSFYYGLTNQVIKHRRLTRWSFPVWLYVTLTGVIVYLMISPFYPR